MVSIDDGLFGCHLDWVEAVLQGDALPLHVMRNGSGRSRPFLLHGRDAAVVVDMRELLGLEELLGTTRRSGYLLARSGTALLALPIDACVGVRELDLRGQTPLPTRLVRDGGLPLGHLVELDGRMLTVLDPHRLLDGSLRDALAPLRRKAAALVERQARIDELWQEIRRGATVELVRAFARLCSRSGRRGAAGAARRVLQHMEAPASTGTVAPDPVDGLVGELIRHQQAGSSGALVVGGDGAEAGGTIVLLGGRVVNARFAGAEGRAAFTRLLGTAVAAPRFTEDGDWSAPARLTDSTIALTIAALESLQAERAARPR